MNIVINTIHLINRFNDCINCQDLDGLRALMTDDHVFTDSAGGSVVGRDNCINAWTGFFATFPDYRNEFTEMKADAGVAVIAGQSVCSDKRLSGSALWKAVIKDQHIAQWHVLDDTRENRHTLGLAQIHLAGHR